MPSQIGLRMLHAEAEPLRAAGLWFLGIMRSVIRHEDVAVPPKWKTYNVVGSNVFERL
jgi:hypothetical protein